MHTSSPPWLDYVRVRGVAVATLLVGLLAGCGESSSTTATDAQSDQAVAAADASAADAATSPVDGGTDATATATDPYAALTAPGPYRVGHRVVQLTYKQNAGLGERTVPLHLWYPTEATTGEHPVYTGLFADDVSLEDVPLAKSASAKGFPIVVHSHGHQGFAGNSAFLMRHVASHGWVAAAPDHVGNTLLDNLDPRPLAIFLQRAKDISATIDWLANPPAGDPLVGQLDLAHIGMSGHSFGTYTTWAIAGAKIDPQVVTGGCEKKSWPDCTPELQAAMLQPLGDPRVKTVIHLAGDGGDIVHNHGIDAVKYPVLQMNGGLDNAGQAELFAAATAVDMTWVKVEGGCHQLYGLGNGVNGPPECKKLDKEEGFSLVRPWYLAWMRRHVLDDADPLLTQLLTGKVLNSPKVSFQHKAP